MIASTTHAYYSLLDKFDCSQLSIKDNKFFPLLIQLPIIKSKSTTNKQKDQHYSMYKSVQEPNSILSISNQKDSCLHQANRCMAYVCTQILITKQQLTNMHFHLAKSRNNSKCYMMSIYPSFSKFITSKTDRNN